MNLFNQITRIHTRFYARYNDAIIFCVPREFVMKAVGEGGSNIKRLREILGKRIRIIQMPRGLHDARGFIQTIIRPVTFKDLEIRGNEIIITAGSMQNKAALMGREKRRLLEMQKIVKDFFGKEFRVI